MDYPLVMASRAAGHLTRKLAMRRLDGIGLFPGQEVVLLQLAERGELNQVTLAEALDVEPPSAAGIITKLEAAGLVSRTAQGREKRITLTPAGQDAATRVREVYAELERTLANGLSPIELTLTLQALGRLSSTAHEALQTRS